MSEYLDLIVSETPENPQDALDNWLAYQQQQQLRAWMALKEKERQAQVGSTEEPPKKPETRKVKENE